jgi:hypothetical protein
MGRVEKAKSGLPALPSFLNPDNPVNLGLFSFPLQVEDGRADGLS